MADKKRTELVSAEIGTIEVTEELLREKLYESATEMCFPDFPYEVGQEGSVFLGAYDGAQCIGLAVLRRDMFRYLYLDDLKVNSAYKEL